MFARLLGKKVCTVAFVIFLCIASTTTKTGEVCFPFGSSESSEAPPQSIQGRPGKIGPRGPPGLQGGVGERGSPGTCACDPNEIEQLREEIRLRNEKIETLLKIVCGNSDRVSCCGVGLKDGRVRNEDLDASSNFGGSYLLEYARLDRQGNNTHYGGWLACRTCRRPGEWIQVDLRHPKQVVAVVTQGLNYPGRAEYWVTSYKISYGNSTSSMKTVQSQSGSDLIFNGNTDSNTHVTNEFPSSIVARYFRLVIQSFHNWGVIRLEYLSC